MPNPYGAAISLGDTKVAAPAIAEAAKNNWAMAVAIVDPSGNLVYYEKMDNTQIGSANVAIEKARSAALFKRPTKTYQDALAAGGDGMRILRLQGAVPIEGGIPILVDGKIRARLGCLEAPRGRTVSARRRERTPSIRRRRSSSQDGVNIDNSGRRLPNPQLS